MTLTFTQDIIHAIIPCYNILIDVICSFGRSSVGSKYARTRSILFAVAGVLFLIAGVTVTVSSKFKSLILI